jgi:predicted nucleic acid-binding protein
MPSRGQWVYWDTSVFLDYFNEDDQHHAVIDEVLRDIRASNGQRLIATLTFTLAEVVHIKSRNTRAGLERYGRRTDGFLLE